MCLNLVSIVAFRPIRNPPGYQVQLQYGWGNHHTICSNQHMLRSGNSRIEWLVPKTDSTSGTELFCVYLLIGSAWLTLVTAPSALIARICTT